VNLPACLIGIEACAGAHFLARSLVAQRYDVKLMPAEYVRPFVKSNKNDYVDAEAITITAGPAHLKRQLPSILEDAGKLLSTRMRTLLMELREEWEKLEEQIEATNRELAQSAKKDNRCQRLLTIPGIGPLTATALTAAIGNGTAFHKSRDLAAWLGLVPRQHSTGGKARLLGISKRGNPYLRRLFIHGGRAVLARVKREDHTFGSWLDRLEGRSPRNVAVVAMANKLARIAWSVLTSGRPYCVPQPHKEKPKKMTSSHQVCMQIQRWQNRSNRPTLILRGHTVRN
jgi:transposase